MITRLWKGWTTRADAAHTNAFCWRSCFPPCERFLDFVALKYCAVSKVMR